MNRLPVESSNIASAGYDAGAQILEVQFKNGGVYQYRGVPQALYDQFLAAKSKGQFLTSHIKSQFPALWLAPSASPEPKPKPGIVRKVSL